MFYKVNLANKSKKSFTKFPDIVSSWYEPGKLKVDKQKRVLVLKSNEVKAKVKVKFEFECMDLCIINTN